MGMMRGKIILLPTKETVGLIIIFVLSLGVIVSTLFLPAIAQDQSYHYFFDTQQLLGIPNFWNVVSNLPFLFVGIWGVLWLKSAEKAQYLQEIKYIYLVFFIAVTLVALGSSYYHLHPSNSTLLWDRLPMTIAFMALFSIILSEFIHIQLGRFLVLPLLLMGLSSVIYWHLSEQTGHGDLRFYAFIQFLPILLIPVILLFFKPSFSLKKAYWLLLVAYLLAKVLEYFDKETYQIISIISGHSLKHIVAAVGIYILIYSYKKRSAIQNLAC